MLLPRLSPGKISPLFRVSPILRTCRSRTTLNTFRSNGTLSPPPKFATKKTLFPERLIVYHAGTGRSAFLACLRVTTIFIFAFFALVAAPTYYYSEDQPFWVAPGVLLSGTVPLVFIAYTSSPFVANIHLRLPVFARHSRELLFRYSKNLPKDAKLEITTMTFIGRPRINLVRATDLRPTRERFGMVNYVRDTTEANSKRPWWMGRAVGKFGMHGSTLLRPGSEVWKNITKGLAKKARS